MSLDVPASAVPAAEPVSGVVAPREAAPKDLARTAGRGVVTTLFGQWTKTALQLISTVVLARLLTPREFGLAASIVALLGLADLLRDFGLTGATVQKRDIDDRLWSSLLWLSLGLGAVMSIVVAACAPLIASLYDEPRLTLITLVMAPSLLMNGACMPLQARLQRSLRFTPLAVLDGAAMAAGVIAAVASAGLGAGVWSLVLLALVSTVTRLIGLLWLVRPVLGRPELAPGLRSIVSTGSSLFGVQALNYAARNADNVLIGKMIGQSALGLYSRAYALLMLPLTQLNGPLARVALPVLSRLQDDAERYRRYLRSSLLVIAYSALPVFAISAAVAGPLVLVVLGDQWLGAAPTFSLLALAGVAQALGNVQGWLYTSLGRAHHQLLYNLATRPLIVLGFVVGLQWDGVRGLAIVYGVSSVALLVPGFYLAKRGTFVRTSDIVRPVAAAVCLTPALFLVPRLVISTVDAPSVVELVLGGLSGLLVMALAAVVPVVRRDYHEVLGFVRKVKGPAAGGPDATPRPSTRTTARRAGRHVR